jgi:hypothetical protein
LTHRNIIARNTSSVTASAIGLNNSLTHSDTLGHISKKRLRRRFLTGDSGPERPLCRRSAANALAVQPPA